MRRLFALSSSVALFAMLAVPLHAEGQRDGRYRIVSGAISSPADRAPDPQDRPLLILVDSWTGRSWSLNEQFRWQPLTFARPSPESAVRDTVPPLLEK
jgi:hypothetical protein